MKVKNDLCYIIIVLILLFSLFIFYFFQGSLKERVTGLAIYRPTNFQGNAPLNDMGDVLVWQGQYYTGTTFNTGTYEFNFTVYDAKEGGNICYSNTTNLTTGNWGEWKTEQYGVNVACNNASKDYFLNINIEGVDQSPRRRLVMFKYLRKDVDETHSHNLNVLGNATFGTKIRLEGEENIIRFNTDIYLDGKGSFEIKNADPYKKVVINKSNINLYTRANDTCEVGFYNADSSNKYKLRYNDSSEIFSIHETNLNKDVVVIKNNKVNFSGNVYGDGNITSNYGFFLYLGSLANKITKLWVQNIDIEKGLRLRVNPKGECNADTEGTIVYDKDGEAKGEFWGCRKKGAGQYEWIKLS